MIRIIMCCLFPFFLLSCGKKNVPASGKILSNNKMQEVLWDILQADAFTERFVKIDTSKNAAVQNAALQKKIFELHKISKEDFYSSYNYYRSHPDLMRTLLDSVSIRAERKRGQMINEKYAPKKLIQYH